MTDLPNASRITIEPTSVSLGVARLQTYTVLNQIRARAVGVLVLARFLPKHQRAVSSECKFACKFNDRRQYCASRLGARVDTFCHTESGSHYT